MNTATSTPGDTRQSAAANKWLVLGIVGLGNLTSSLLGSTVNVVLPLIRSEFQVDLALIEWVVTGYMLTTASLLIFFGRLGDIVGHKRVYTSGFLLFFAGCIAGGLAPSIGFLIAGRILQAMGGAMILSLSAALITAAFPADQRGQALGMQAATVYIGLTLGPTFGGLVAGWLGWHWVFLILGPLALVCGTLAAVLLPSAPPSRRQGFDPAGAVLFAASLSAMLTVLSNGGTWGWSSSLTLGVFLTGLLVAGLFIWTERRVPFPMIPLSLFGSRVFSSGVGAAVSNYAAGATLMFLLPFYLIELRGFSPSAAGLIMSAQALVMVAVAPVAGWISDRVGTRELAAAGLLLQGLSLVLVTRLGGDSPQWAIAAVQGLMGLGAGLFTTPNNSAIMGAAPRESQGLAAGLLASARTAGMVLGVALAGAVFRGLQSWHLATGSASEGAFLSAMSGALYAGAAIAGLGVLATLTRGARPRARQ